MSDQEKLEPTIIVIFGITGDLSRKYLLPALYHLVKDDLLNPLTEIVGISRRDVSASQVLEKLGQDYAEETLDKMGKHMSMFKMDLDDPDAYDGLLERLNEIEEERGVCMNRLYYLSIPPKAYVPVVHLLGERGLNDSCQHGRAATRLLVEKPFGYDLKSAQELIDKTAEAFNEEQIFRIDHYLAKETVQNILTFRFQNPIFEDMWNNEHISSIEIIAKEEIGIQGRAVFYEPLGALRDFIQSHLLQIMGIVTMDKPEDLSSQDIHSSKQTALGQVEPVPSDKVSERVVRGQYSGYREEVDNPGSNTETFAAVTLFIENKRWKGVPIKLMTGKALDERRTEVRINFKGDGSSNRLVFRIQPNEGIEVDLATKKPGFDYAVEKTAMDFSYKNKFDGAGHPDAYERVLVDAVRGDHTLFATSSEVLAAWTIVQPVLDVWASSGDDLKVYQPGSKGPEA
jgi:glucose-6-phosphate 1-dehydrogenase